MRFRPRASYFPPGAGDVEGLRYRPVVQRGLRLTVPARSGRFCLRPTHPRTVFQRRHWARGSARGEANFLPATRLALDCELCWVVNVCRSRLPRAGGGSRTVDWTERKR